MSSEKKFNIDYIAKLARIRLKTKEKNNLSKELKKVLSFVEKLNEVNTEKIEPISSVLPKKNILRKDEIFYDFNKEDFWKILPEKEDSFVKVPKIIEK